MYKNVVRMCFFNSDLCISLSKEVSKCRLKKSPRSVLCTCIGSPRELTTLGCAKTKLCQSHIDPNMLTKYYLSNASKCRVVERVFVATNEEKIHDPRE